MLVIEGGDLVGKTTLAKKLVARLADEGYVYKHFSRLPDKFDRFWGYVENAVTRSVQDRFHMSEVMYSEMRGDDTMLCPQRYRMVDGHLRTRGALTVIVTCDERLLASRAPHEDEMYGRDQILAVNSMFERVVQERGQFSHHVHGLYHMDFDVAVECDDSKPYPDDYDVDHIITSYSRRLATWQRVMSQEQYSRRLPTV
jgi:thymidylate kinase